MEETIKPEDANSISDVVMYDGFEMQKIIRKQLKTIQMSNKLKF